jgi:hypothetical protein
VISYTVTVSRDVIETVAVNVRAANRTFAVNRALAVARENDNLDWERKDHQFKPNPYAGIYDVTETE